MCHLRYSPVCCVCGKKGESDCWRRGRGKEENSRRLREETRTEGEGEAGGDGARNPLWSRAKSKASKRPGTKPTKSVLMQLLAPPSLLSSPPALLLLLLPPAPPRPRLNPTRNTQDHPAVRRPRVGAAPAPHGAGLGGAEEPAGHGLPVVREAAAGGGGRRLPVGAEEGGDA